MTIVFEDRASDSPYLEVVSRGHMATAGTTVRPAETHWHMVFVQEQGRMHPIMVGPLTKSDLLSYGGEAEVLWVKFKLGTYMPHMPLKGFRDMETTLPTATQRSFWLQGAAWEIPTFDNVETFVERLVRQDILRVDPVVAAVLEDDPYDRADRTVRYRFIHTTGLTQAHIRQVQRAQRAAQLLEQGTSILDTVHVAGYFDQPHLTRALKQWIGHTPAQLVRQHDSSQVTVHRES